MPNAVKYLSNPLSGSIQIQNVSIGVDGGSGPTGTTGWYNGITPTTGKYIVYDVGTVAGIPLIYAPQTDAELIRLANSKGAGGVTTVAGALEWFASQFVYAAVNKAYPNIITDGLIYLVDSTFTPSYPTTGTTSYPIKDVPLVGNGALQNGVGFDSNMGAFIFDGSDDQIPLAGSNNFANIDWSAGLTLAVLYKIDATTDFNSQFRCMIGVTGGSRTWNYYLYGPSTPATSLYYHFSGNGGGSLSNLLTITTGNYHLGIFTIVPGTGIGTYYHDGVAAGTQGQNTTVSYTTAGGAQYLGRGDNMWKGNIAKVMIYNKALTQSEIYQTYYQGNIVTGSLSYIWDAGNLISYIGTGTTTYNMTGSINGTLQNGITYNPGYGGYWSFDGADDRILLDNYNYSFSLGDGNSNWTVNAWVKTTTTANGLGAGPILSNSNGGPVYSEMGINGGKIVYWVYPSNINNWKGWTGNITVNDGTWHMLTWVNKVGYTMDMYVDGVLDVTVSPTNAGNNNPIDIIGGCWASNFQGDIATVQVYQGKAFNSSEVKQNFSAYSSRFGK